MCVSEPSEVLIPVFAIVRLVLNVLYLCPRLIDIYSAFLDANAL